jgi:hypothetical protein
MEVRENRAVERHLRRWLEEFVVGLDLCPFARPLLGSPALRIAVCADTEPATLRRAYLEELDCLQRSSEEAVATTLLAFPSALDEFDDFLDFVHEADGILDACGLRGHVQLASFHPRYRFAGEPEDAASHFSNRAPYPLLHLLRENMLDRQLAGFPGPEQIPARNIERLNGIGSAEMARRWHALFSDET